MIVVLFWMLLAWFWGLAGDIGRAWWSNFGAAGGQVTHSGTGAIVGLFVVGFLMLGLAGLLRQGWRARRLLGMLSVTLAMLGLADLGTKSWLTSLTLLGLGAACARGPGAMNAAALTLIGLVLGGSHQVKALVITATAASHFGSGELGLIRLALVLALVVVGAGAIVLSARRVGVFGEAFLMQRWRQWGWGARHDVKTGVEAPVTSTATPTRPGPTKQGPWHIWRGRDDSA